MTAEQKAVDWVGRGKLIAAGVLAVLALVLIIQNRDFIPYNVLFWRPMVPRFLPPLLGLAVGCGAGVVAAKLLAWRKK